MRNLRKLTAVVIAIALVLTSMATAFAATSPENADKAATLKALGLYAGTDDSDVAAGLDGDLTTEDALIFLAKLFGYFEDASALPDAQVEAGLATTFADADKISGYAEKVVAYSALNGILSGSLEGGKLYVKPTETVTAARFATFILKQLGYEVEDWEVSVIQLAEVEGSAVTGDEDGDLTRDQAVGFMYAILTAEYSDGATVIDEIVGDDAALKAIAVEAGLIVATTLDVASVTASNLRELVVKYTGTPVAAEAKKKENYKIGTKTAEAVTVSEDGKTVTLRLASADALSNYGTVDLTIEKAVGFDAKKEVKGVAVKDTTVPEAKSAKTTGPKTIKVTLSEPLNTHDVDGVDGTTTALIDYDIVNAVKIDGGLLGVNPTGTTVSGLELTVVTYSDLSEGSHTIEFAANSKLMDNAGYRLQKSTLSFEHVKDTSDLVLEYVESNETSVTVKFNKAIDVSTFISADVKIAHTYNTETRQTAANTAGFITNVDGQKFTINFGEGNPLPPGSTTVYITGYDKIKDGYGNKLKTSSITVGTSADLTKPTATAEFVDANNIKVTYSEAVSNEALKASNYVLKIGTTVVSLADATDFVADSGKKVVKLTTTSLDALNGTEYTLTIKNVTDTSVAKNKIDEVTLTFTGSDAVAPAVDTAKSKLVAANKYKLVFTEALDTAIISSKALYKLSVDGGATISDLKGDDAIEVVDGGKAVVITFKTSVLGTSNIVYAGWLKDVAGNYSKAFQNPTTAFGTTPANIDLAAYQIVSKTGIKLKFADVITGSQYGDFLYSTQTGIWVAPESLSSVTVEDGNTYVTLVTKDLGTTIGTNVEVKSIASTNAKNAYGTTLLFDSTGITTGTVAVTIADKAAPAKSSIAFTTTGDAKGTKETLATVTITYSEPLYAASVQDTDYTVAGYEITNVVVNNDKVTLTVKTLDYGAYTVNESATVKVTQTGEIQDSAKNTLGAQSEWSATQTVVAAP